MNWQRSGMALGLVVLASCAPRVDVAPARLQPSAPRASMPLPQPPAPRAARSPVDPERHAALHRSAANHTNAARALVEQAGAATAGPERRPLLLRAIDEYWLAARDWTALFTHDPQAADTAETRYWIADAWDRMLVLDHEVGGTPSAGELASARRAILGARDTSVGLHRASAAFMLVEIADLALHIAEERYMQTRGAEGVEERVQLRTTGEGDNEWVVKDPLPREVEGTIAARDAYIESVPRAEDPDDNRTLYAYQTAEVFFLYGHLDEARRRFLPLSDPAKCGSSGHRAWARLVDIAALKHDVPSARALMEAGTKAGCDVDEPRHAPRPDPPNDEPEAAAHRLFSKAERADSGPERDELWKQSAQGYEEELRRAPDSRWAPEYAIMGAIAYKQIGSYDKAVAMYRLFLQTYGSEASLARFEKGDPRATPPLLPDAHGYQVRLKYTRMVVDSLAAAEVLELDYEAGAEDCEALARNARFDPEHRRYAATHAAILYALIGDLDRARLARDLVASLHSPVARLAEADWILARASLRVWDAHAPDSGPNRAARLSALSSMRRWRAVYRGKATLVLELHAAYEMARLLRAGRDPGADGACRDVVRAFEASRTAPSENGGALGPTEADMAAECAYGAIDERLRADFDYSTGHHRYAGRTVEVERAYHADLDKAERLSAELQDVAARFASHRWTAVAKARQASLYDSCRTGLHAARPRALALDRADGAMIKLYAEAVLLARTHEVHDAAIDVAIRRLAYFTEILGDAKIREQTRNLTDPATKAPFQYADGFFVRMRPGMPLGREPDALAAPRPATP